MALVKSIELSYMSHIRTLCITPRFAIHMKIVTFPFIEPVSNYSNITLFT